MIACKQPKDQLIWKPSAVFSMTLVNLMCFSRSILHAKSSRTAIRCTFTDSSLPQSALVLLKTKVLGLDASSKSTISKRKCLNKCIAFASHLNLRWMTCKVMFTSLLCLSLSTRNKTSKASSNACSTKLIWFPRSRKMQSEINLTTNDLTVILHGIFR